MSNKIQVSLPEEELDWIQLRQDLGPIAEVETTKEKLQRKIKENPLVPLGEFSFAALRRSFKRSGLCKQNIICAIVYLQDVWPPQQRSQPDYTTFALATARCRRS